VSDWGGAVEKGLEGAEIGGGGCKFGCDTF